MIWIIISALIILYGGYLLATQKGGIKKLGAILFTWGILIALPPYPTEDMPVFILYLASTTPNLISQLATCPSKVITDVMTHRLWEYSFFAMGVGTAMALVGATMMGGSIKKATNAIKASYINYLKVLAVLMVVVFLSSGFSLDFSFILPTAFFLSIPIYLVGGGRNR